MSERTSEPEPPAYHLLLDPDEVPVVARALRLLISDEAHQPEIRRFAREVLAQLEQRAPRDEPLSVALSPQQMKITHSALRLLFNDLRRGQPEQLALLQAVLAKLPDEHAIRAIVLE